MSHRSPAMASGEAAWQALGNEVAQLQLKVRDTSGALRSVIGLSVHTMYAHYLEDCRAVFVEHAASLIVAVSVRHLQHDIAAFLRGLARVPYMRRTQAF